MRAIFRALPNHIFLIGGVLVIGIAVAGTLFMRTPTLNEVDLFIPIESQIPSQSVVVLSPHPAGLDIRLRGTAEALSRLAQKSFRYPVKMADGGTVNVKNGIQTITVDSNLLGLPTDVAIVHFQPQKITVRIERLMEKTLTIKAVFMGTPASNFTVENAGVLPDKVNITGPESIVSEMMHIEIKPVDINGISTSFRKRATLDLPDGVMPASAGPFFVEVTVKEKLVVKKLNHIVIQGRGANGPYQISPPSIDLTIEGPPQAFINLTSSPDFDVYVDLAALRFGVYVRRAVILLPLNMTLVKAVPELFTIHIGSK